MKRCWPILLLALPLGCAAPDPQDAACNDWLDGRRAELGLQPGTRAFEACMTVARRRDEARRQITSFGM